MAGLAVVAFLQANAELPNRITGVAAAAVVFIAYSTWNLIVFYE